MPRRKVNPVNEIAKALAKLGKASFGDILRETGLAEPTIARHLKHMEIKKLILSEQHPKDKRKYLYWLNPNELAVITIDEVIEAVKDELSTVNEELTPKEEMALREALKNMHEPIKTAIIEGETAILSGILFWLDGLAVLRYVTKFGQFDYKALIPLLEIGEKSQKLIRHIIDACLPNIPHSFAEKWINARKKKNILLTTALAIIEQIIKIMSNNKIKVKII